MCFSTSGCLGRTRTSERVWLPHLHFHVGFELEHRGEPHMVRIAHDSGQSMVAKPAQRHLANQTAKKSILCAAIFVAWAATDAWAYCSDPSPPSRISKPSPPSEPPTPYCVNKYAGTHTCSEWEISNYNRAIDQYNDDLRSYRDDVSRYIKKLTAYVDDAEEYAVCEMKSLE